MRALNAGGQKKILRSSWWTGGAFVLLCDRN